jgi:hypothetical protein
MKERFFLDGIDSFRTHEPIGRRIQYATLIFSHTTYPVFSMGNGAAVTTQRALYYVIFFFCVLACFMHNRVPSLFDWLFRFITFCFVIIYFKDKRSPVFAVLAEVYLPHIPPGDRENLPALTDRTAQHGRVLTQNNSI